MTSYKIVAAPCDPLGGWGAAPASDLDDVLSQEAQTYIDTLDTSRCGGRGRDSLINAFSQTCACWFAKGSHARYMARYSVNRLIEILLNVAELMGVTWPIMRRLQNTPGFVGEASLFTARAIGIGQLIYWIGRVVQHYRTNPSVHDIERLGTAITRYQPGLSDMLETSKIGSALGKFFGNTCYVLFWPFSFIIPDLRAHYTAKSQLRQFLRSIDRKLFSPGELDSKLSLLEELQRVHDMSGSTIVRDDIETMFAKIVKNRAKFSPFFNQNTVQHDYWGDMVANGNYIALEDVESPAQHPDPNVGRFNRFLNYVFKIRNDMGPFSRHGFDYTVGFRDSCGGCGAQSVRAFGDVYTTGFKAVALMRSDTAWKIFLIPVLSLFVWMFGIRWNPNQLVDG